MSEMGGGECEMGGSGKGRGVSEVGGGGRGSE